MWYTILACVVVVALIVVGVAMVLLRRSSSVAAVDAPVVQAAQASSKAICRNRIGVDGVTTKKCDDWAAKGSCTSVDHAAYMRRYCELSCARAGAPVPCTIATEQTIQPEVYSTPAATSNDRTKMDQDETSRTLHIHSLLDELTTIVAAEEAQERQELQVCTEYYAEKGRMNRAAAQLEQLEELEKLKSQLVAAELEHEHNEVLECQGLARAWLTTLTDGGASVSNADVKARLKLCPEDKWESTTCPGNEQENCAEISSLSTEHTPCSGSLPKDNTFLVECVVPTCKGADDTTAKLAGYHPDIGVQSSGASELLVDYTQMDTVKCTVDPKWGTGCSAPRHDMVGDDGNNYFDELAPQTKAKAYAEYSKLTLENNFKHISGTGANDISGYGYMLRYANNNNNCTANPVVHAGDLNFVQSGIGVKGKFDGHQSTKTREYNQIVGPYELTPVLCRDACEEGLFGSVGDSATIHSEQLKTAQKYVPHYKKFFKGATSAPTITISKFGTDAGDGKYTIDPEVCDWGALPASGYFADVQKALGNNYYGYYFEPPNKLTLSGTTAAIDPSKLNLMNLIGAFMPKSLKCTAADTVGTEMEARFKCLLDPFRYVGFTMAGSTVQLCTHGGSVTVEDVFVQHNISVVHSCVSTCMNSGVVSPFDYYLQTAAAKSPDNDSLIIDAPLFNHPDWLKEPLGTRLKHMFKLPIPAGTGYIDVKAKNDQVCTDMVIPDHDAEFGRFHSPVSTARDYAAFEDRRGCPTPTETAGSGYVCAAYAPKALAISPLSDPCLRNTDGPTCATTVACAWDGGTCTSVVCSGHNSQNECIQRPQCAWSAGNCVQNPSQKKVQARCADGQVSRMGWCECTDGTENCDAPSTGICVKAAPSLTSGNLKLSAPWLEQAHIHKLTHNGTKATICVLFNGPKLPFDDAEMYLIAKNATSSIQVTAANYIPTTSGGTVEITLPSASDLPSSRVIVKHNGKFMALNDYIYTHGECRNNKFRSQFVGPLGVCVDKLDQIYNGSAANHLEHIDTARKARGLYTNTADVLAQNFNTAYPTLYTTLPARAQIRQKMMDSYMPEKTGTNGCLQVAAAALGMGLTDACVSAMNAECLQTHDKWSLLPNKNAHNEMREWVQTTLIESRQKLSIADEIVNFCYAPGGGRMNGGPTAYGAPQTGCTGKHIDQISVGYRFRTAGALDACLGQEVAAKTSVDVSTVQNTLKKLEQDTFANDAPVTPEVTSDVKKPQLCEDGLLSQKIGKKENNTLKDFDGLYCADISIPTGGIRTEDFGEWTDKSGNNCQAYVDKGWCSKDQGKQTSATDVFRNDTTSPAKDGAFHRWFEGDRKNKLEGSNGMTAKEACCGCGGGSILHKNVYDPDDARQTDCWGTRCRMGASGPEQRYLGAGRADLCPGGCHAFGDLQNLSNYVDDDVYTWNHPKEHGGGYTPGTRYYMNVKRGHNPLETFAQVQLALKNGDIWDPSSKSTQKFTPAQSWNTIGWMPPDEEFVRTPHYSGDDELIIPRGSIPPPGNTTGGYDQPLKGGTEWTEICRAPQLP